MDALAQLALMTKATMVFGTPGTFLSFPALTPISYTPDQMKFLDATTSAQMHAFAEFSMLTNAFPQGTLFQPSLDQLLSDVYLGVLQNAQVAQGSSTAQQAADLQAAQAFLTVQDPNGLLVDSPQVVAYKQYQQAWFRATQNYNDQEATAEASTDPRVQAQWQNTGQAVAQAQVQAAENDWETKGFKMQVEQAQQVEQTYATRSPQTKWNSWVASCNPTVDFLTDPVTNSPFAPTVFAPCDIFDKGGWAGFSISGSDIPNLVNQAPSELRSIFDTTSSASTIDSLSFEYCSAALSRPWFHSDLFAARFWRLSDPTVQLSDGQTPPHGDWPAYVAALVFARNIVVTMRGAAQSQPVQSFPPLALESVHVAPQPIIRSVSVLLRPRGAVAPSAAMTPQTVAPPAAMRAPSGAEPRPILAGRVVLESAVPTARAEAPSEPRPQAMPAFTINPALRARLSAATFSGATTAPAGTASSQTQSSGAQISILAFICKRLPKCPNPDPSLNWG